MSHDEACNCKDDTCGCEGGGDCNCSCEGCGEGSHFERYYQTKDEQISTLEAYLGELKLEVQAVEEHLTDLRK
jgi:hypothetical protein